jgi:LPXTG-motif cell wall-anchored protein
VPSSTVPQSDQNAAQSSQSNAAQSSTSTTTSDQTSKTTSDQNANNAKADDNANAGNKKLPQTATPLPLLALLGLGSLTGGIAARKKKK